MASTTLPFRYIAWQLLILLLLSAVHFSRVIAIGVNWGTSASHPLPPAQVVQLLKANNVTKVKLFDADPDVLQALAGSNIYVTVGIPNSMLRSLNSSLKAAESWVHDNLTRYVSDGAGSVRVEYFSFILSLIFIFGRFQLQSTVIVVWLIDEVKLSAGGLLRFSYLHRY